MIGWKKVSHFPRNLVLLMILLYQKTISPDHGIFKTNYPNGFCRFYPTCSEYGFQIIKKRGLLIGVPLLFWRILRCNPWNDGGIDNP